MDFYQNNIQYDGSLDKMKLIIVVIGYLYNKDLIGYTWSPTAPMRAFKCLLIDSVKKKARVNQLAKYVDTETVKKSTLFNNTTFHII